MLKTLPISDLYRVFGRYQLGADFIGCSHCVDPEKTRHLAQAALPSLSLSDLDSYSLKAMTTWGEVEHFKHFLPRLLELAVVESPESFTSLEVLFSKLAYAKWTNWLHEEYEAVNVFLQFFWGTRLSDEVGSRGDTSIDTVVCSLGRACPSILAYLEQWLDDDRRTSKLQLAQFICVNYDSIVQRSQLWNSYWESTSKPHQEVLRWIGTDELRESVRRSCQVLADRFLNVAHQLDTIRASLGK
jgi:hypothetical protein